MSRRMTTAGIAALAVNTKPKRSVTPTVPQGEAVCAYCTTSLEELSRVYQHEKQKHVEPRPTFCSHACLRHYDARRVVEIRTFGR